MYHSFDSISTWAAKRSASSTNLSNSASQLGLHRSAPTRSALHLEDTTDRPAKRIKSSTDSTVVVVSELVKAKKSARTTTSKRVEMGRAIKTRKAVSRAGGFDKIIGSFKLPPATSTSISAVGMIQVPTLVSAGPTLTTSQATHPFLKRSLSTFNPSKSCSTSAPAPRVFQPTITASLSGRNTVVGPKRNRFDVKESLSRISKGYVAKSGLLNYPPLLVDIRSSCADFQSFPRSSTSSA